MGFRIESRHLGEVVVIVPEVFADERGFFLEVFRADAFRELGLPHEFAQDNHSRSKKGVVRGLHFQWEPPMGKLMRVTRGRAFLVAVDIRQGSPTLGQWFGLEALRRNRKMVWAPGGFARGSARWRTRPRSSTSAPRSTTPRAKARFGGTTRRLESVAVGWGDYILSEKDRRAPTLAEWLASASANKLKY
jgi:dTDP-4-dehydrorhamnose 3,5-epimerase